MYFVRRVRCAQFLFHYLFSLGEHPLHIAVVNQNFAMVKLLVESNAKINQPRCTGLFFRPKSTHCQVYWGEHIIAFAVCTGQKEIVKYLLDHGASLSVIDAQVRNTAASRSRMPFILEEHSENCIFICFNCKALAAHQVWWETLLVWPVNLDPFAKTFP